MLLSTKHKNDIMVATRNKDYSNLNPLSGKDNDQPSNSTQYISIRYTNVLPTELTIKPPKGFIHKSTFTPRARVG